MLNIIWNLFFFCPCLIGLYLQQVRDLLFIALLQSASADFHHSEVSWKGSSEQVLILNSCLHMYQKRNILPPKILTQNLKYINPHSEEDIFICSGSTQSQKLPLASARVVHSLPPIKTGWYKCLKSQVKPVCSNIL